MPQKKKSWMEYNNRYPMFAKVLATATLPITFGPFIKNDAYVFSKAFYRYRKALYDTNEGEDYPIQLHMILDTMICAVSQSGGYVAPENWVVEFRTDPIIKSMDKIDVATAQVAELEQLIFKAKQQPQRISEPLFTEEEMDKRKREIIGE